MGHANVDETYDQAGPHNLGQTTAVGLYPQGVSPLGLLDCAGNVWDWCLDKYRQPGDTATPRKERAASGAPHRSPGRESVPEKVAARLRLATRRRGGRYAWRT